MGVAIPEQRRFRFLLLAAACALAAAGAAAAAAEPAADTQSVWVTGTRDPSAWVRAESPHLVVLTDTSGEAATRLLTQLERLDTLLRLYMAPIRKADPDTAAKPILYYLNGRFGFERFAPGAPARAVGLVNSCAAGVLGVGLQVGPIDALADAELAHAPLDQGLSYLFEAYARHFIFRYTDVRAPAAVIEGLARYFSAVRFSDTQMAVGRTPTGIKRYLALLDEGHQYEADYGDVFAQTYARAPDFDVDARARTRQLEIEARAWTLVHYMLSNEERRARMPGFLDAVHHGESPSAAFERSYGIKGGDLSNAMWRYRLTAKTMRVELQAAAAAPVATRRLSRAEGEFVLAEARRAGCLDAGKGEALLRKSSEQAAQMGDSGPARAGIARIQVDWGTAEQVAQALAPLRQAAARAPTDADAAYWLGRADLRLAEREPARLADAQAELARATDLRPGEPVYALARLQAALAARPEPDRPALAAVIAAWRGARDNNVLAREAVLAYAVSGDPVDASHTMQVLANDSRDPGAQAWAADWRARLEKGVAPAVLYAEMRHLGQAGAAVQEWTLDEDAEAQDVERKQSIDNIRRAIPLTAPGSPAGAMPDWLTR